MAERTEEEQERIDSAKLSLELDVAGAEESLDQMIVSIWLSRSIEGGVAELAEHLAQLLAEHARAAATWPIDTINARLDAAFVELDTIGIMGLHHCSSDQSSGWTAAWEYSELRTPTPRGATFYHAQDLESALEGRGLHLAYGALKDHATDDDDIAIGREVFAMLEKHGVPARWSGSVRSRIQLLPFPWQRRRHDGLTTLAAAAIRDLADPPKPEVTCGCGAMQLAEWIDEDTGEVLSRCERCGEVLR